MNEAGLHDPIVWVFIAQVEEHRNDNERPWVRIPLKSRLFFGLLLHLPLH